MKNWWDEGRVASICRPKRGSDVGTSVRTMQDLETLYNIEEVAAYFKVAVGTIYKWKCSGLIEATMHGRNLRFTAKQMDECKHRLQHGWRKRKRKSEKRSG